MCMETITIKHINESNVGLLCNPGVIRELSDAFSFRVPGYRFQPKFKAGIWDGYIRLINARTHMMPKGLVPHLVNKSTELGYKVKFEEGFVDRFKEDIELDLSKYNLKFPPRDFQEKALATFFRKKRSIVISPTGSGKSFIVYLAMRALLDHVEEGQILIMVPRVGLVRQIFSDFEDYAVNDSWNASDDVVACESKQDRLSSKRVIISTWQGLQHMPKNYFERFIGIIGDEVHEYEAKVGSTVLNNCSNAFYRLGLTGTLKDAKTHELALTGSFGPAVQVIETHELMERGTLADLDITALILKYQDVGSINSKTKYQEEVDWVVRNEKRLTFTAKLAANCTGNTLVLFNFVEKHGKPLHEKIQEVAKGKEVYFVYGGTDSDQRERVRKLAESKNNVIIIASYGTFSTGINIVNIKNIILASPTKGKIRLLQSIGRGLRRSDAKQLCKLFDIVDDVRGKRKALNYCMKHFKERYDIYVRQKFKVKIKQLTI